MAMDWKAFQQVLIPIKGYDELCRRFTLSFSYPCIQAAYNFSLPDLHGYTHQLLGGDSRQRYSAYLAQLLATLGTLHRSGLQDVRSLLDLTTAPNQLEPFVERTLIPAVDIAAVLKYLAYWVIPAGKYLSGLVREDPPSTSAIQVLKTLGIRTNLDLLQAGLTPASRLSLAHKSGLSPSIIIEWVNRADFSRLPWSSKATISNILGAGYASLYQLANANSEQLYADFFRYGKSIGKNLKLGNEIENSYRIARLIPVLLQ